MLKDPTGRQPMSTVDLDRLAVALDLGPFMLIRLRPAGARRHDWWAVTAAEAGAAWPALRAALYSRPPETTPRGRPPERAAD